MNLHRTILLTGFALFACEESPSTKAAPPQPAAHASAAPAAVVPSAAPTAEPRKVVQKKHVEDCPKSSTVSFDDPAFEDAVRKKSGKAKGAITSSDLGKLRSLNVSSVKLDQLDPCIFPLMKGLKELFLGPGEYDDISPLAGLTQLESLRASISQVKDVKALAKMVKLDRLDLGRTQVTDLAPLAEMKALTELQLDDTPVEDLAPLAKLSKLERLSIQRTKVKDVAALKGLKALKFLYINGTPLEGDPMALAPVRANGTKIISQ